MANPKPKKAPAKKPSTKPEPKKVEKTTTAPAPVAKSTDKKAAVKGFFARKCDQNESVLTIFKTPRIWGALVGELVGTMLIMMILLTLGMNPLYLFFAVIGVYVAVVTLSGANLNPLVTVGMMATRRMSAIRGVLYILAQVLGAWVGLIIINAFRLSSGTLGELPIMDEVTGETFWAVALVELMGAMIIGFCFARAVRFMKKSPLTFAFTVASGLLVAVLLGIVVSQSFFVISNGIMFNPAMALMYQILPTAADNFGELAGMAGLALAAYVVFPIIGGVLGFFISDIAGRFVGCGYSCSDCDACCNCGDPEHCTCQK